MRNMQLDMMSPPVMIELRRPHASAYRKAGIVMRSMRIAETPDAKKDDVPAGRPA